MRQTESKIARAGADVGNDFAGFQVEGHHHFMRLLVCVALGIFQQADVRLWIVVQAVHLVFISFDGVLGPDDGGKQNDDDDEDNWDIDTEIS